MTTVASPGSRRRWCRGLYVCGITPYDATHLGHAATYLAFDTLMRLWLDAGYEVRYAQNTTDVDDPLLERAAATGVDWRQLAADQIELFRQDMEALGIIPPDHYVAVTEVIEPVADAVEPTCSTTESAYPVDDDVYFDSAAAAAASPWKLGDVSGLDRRHHARAVRRARGRPRAARASAIRSTRCSGAGARAGEPSWPSAMGHGRPGWHIECSVIAERYLDIPVTVNGGGSDLVFPHHEFSAGHTAALTGMPLASLYSHAGMVAYQGEKMSKSLGNLVLVSRLRDGGHGSARHPPRPAVRALPQRLGMDRCAPRHVGGPPGAMGQLGGDSRRR